MKKNSSVLVDNRSASFHYDISDEYEAGIILTGGEVKSLRSGGGSLKGAWCRFKDGKLFVIGFKIKKYKSDSSNKHQTERDKELLLHKRELDQLKQKMDQDKKQLIPLKVFKKHGLIKIKLGLGTALKKHDKRAKIKDREVKLRTKQLLGKI